MVAAVAVKLGCRVEFLGQRLPDGSMLPDDRFDGRAVSVFGVPDAFVAHGRALGLTVEALAGTVA